MTRTKELKSVSPENTLSFQEKYDAIGKKDTHFEGIFITAVKTTGIFCRPTCRARKPRAENEIQDYFSGSRRNFTVPLHTPGTPFQQSVWNKLQKMAA